MIKSALLGMDISYTRSPAVHRAIADVLGIDMSFDVVDVNYDGLDSAVKNLTENYDGFFITKPYKNEIKRYLNKLNTHCGVNFVTCKDKSGYNTDGIGFIGALSRAFPDYKSKIHGALVLGAGGAAASTAEALLKDGISTYVLNRTRLTAAKLCSLLGAEEYLNQPAELIVNCTSCGLHGEDVLRELCVPPTFDYAFDLIYEPPQTAFTQKTERAGAKVSNGRDMLIFQAIEGDRILTGLDFDVGEVFEKVSKLL